MMDQPNEKPSHENAVSAESAGAVADFCKALLSHLGLDLNVHARVEGATVLIDLSGPDRSLLLSGTAAVLNSLEYLLNKAFRTGKGNGIDSIALDSEHYRKHREAELVLLAEMASKKVLSQRRPLSLQPMTPKERRIIHLALSGTEGIRTESTGEGENRSITIYPS